MADNKDKLREQDNEIYFLIQYRRLAARRAMDSILSIANAPESHHAKWIFFLEYINNMAYCLELMLKLLSGNFENHKVKAMYRKVFGCDHPSVDFMDAWAEVLRSQKYLVRPVEAIQDYVIEIEELFDQLQDKLVRTPNAAGEHRSMTETTFDVALSPRVVEYLTHNAQRFHIHPIGWNANLDDYCDHLRWEVGRIQEHLIDLADYRLDFILRFNTFSIPWLE